MRRLNYLPSLIIIALLFTLASCVPNTTSPAYPNPATANTLPLTTTPVTVITPIIFTPLPVTPTSTFAKKWEVNTPTPISTADPNFLSGTLATIAKNNALNYSDEDLFKVLVSQWLEKYKTGVISSNPITDYRVDNIFIDHADELKTVAFVEISVQYVDYSINWTTITIRLSDSNDPWRHVGGLFAIYREGEYFLLKWQTI
ncbi:MAG: hypothetical protein HY863_08815 [Chloroflexi bacterium]|nr:hypothetical protein [Chloroflexota bacterium]